MTNTNLIDITPIIEIVITLLGAIITFMIIPWIKSKLDSNQWNNLNEYAAVFVKCAEMIFKGTNLGKDKKKWVIEKLTAIAEEHNLKFSAEAIEAALENAVSDMNEKKNKDKEEIAIQDYKPEISE